MIQPFLSLYSHGYVRVAVGVPKVKVGDPEFNARESLALARQAHRQHAAVALFPELGLSSYTCDDLFHQDALLDASEVALKHVLTESRELNPLLLVGLPLRFEDRLFNCAVALHRGRILGVVPKSFLPNYREFYEKRYFASARQAIGDRIRLLGQEVPFGSDLIFEAEGMPDFKLHAEVCEDLWVPIPPSTWAALAGATVLTNMSASNITVGKADFRRALCASQSGRCLGAYLFAAAGPGESTTDMAWDGQGLIYENGELLAEGKRFSRQGELLFADIDLERLRQERLRLTSFGDSIGDHRERLRSFRRIPFAFERPDEEIALERAVDRFPYVPSDRELRDERCFEAYEIQIHGLIKRLEATGIRKLVIGVSGGLDSTQALLVAVKTVDRLGLPRENILAYTLPGFATSERTLRDARALMAAFGVTAGEIDIRPSARQMLADLDHPFAKGEAVHDITFENVQAGERTSHLFRLANFHDALVLGTGDLSELALGWTTYGVGDQMSHYNVNTSVPKTLIQYLIRWEIETGRFEGEAARILASILDTEISPELIPGDGPDDGPAQRTEDVIGPYELQDFHLYFLTRFGFRPSKVAFLALHAWGDRERGDWPETMADEDRRQYDLATIKKWLGVFLYRFFKVSQFKRSASPNGPKVGSGGSLSPRGDWRAPSDGEAEVWLRELKENVP
ncbi:MAG: NAD(+) synthase [Acidobacteriota bacterium]